MGGEAGSGGLWRRVLALTLALGLAACAEAPHPPPVAPTTANSGHVQLTRDRVLGQGAIPVYGFKVLRRYPHDTAAYTEGLVIDGGLVYEGTGLYGQSKLRRYELESGAEQLSLSLAAQDFGEGVALHGDRVYQLTYLGNQGYRYDKADFAPKGGFRYDNQGWGLTSDGERLIMSDGSSAILFRDPESFAVTGRVYAHDAVGPVGFLNELEWVDGTLYANVWQTDFIAMIDPASGAIVGWIDLIGLNPDPRQLVYPLVLNGIAFNRASGHLVVTGKCWPWLYEIELVPRGG